MGIFERLAQNVIGNSLDDAILRGASEGIRLGFENAAFEKCDGKDNPDERCPQPSGKCVCAYVYWRQLPKWKQFFTDQPPRPSREDCFNVMTTPLILEEIAKRKEKK